MITSRGIIILFASLFLIIACQPELDPGPGNNNPGQPTNPSPLQASVYGIVVDENNAPITGATVRAANKTASTDSRGIFRITDVSLDKYAAVVKVEMAGYFDGIRTYSTRQNATGFVKIKLLPKNITGTINASAGGTVTLSNNSTLTFTANSVVNKSTGTAYNGQVNVYTRYIDPTASDMPFMVPGSMQATNAQNVRTLLTSYGMIAVELQSTAGEELQLANGKTARMKLAIPSALLGTAPSTMPLWSLNETDGLWRQEGTANKSGNFYEGNVSHFSFWNCDISSNAVFLEMTIHTIEGALPNTQVRITRLNSNTYSYGFTDSSGYVAGFVPDNEPLKLEIFNNCGNAIYSQNIGPYSQNTNLGTITVTLQPQYAVTITGTAVNCSSQPVTDGTVFIYFEGHSYQAAIDNGSFSVQLTRCGNASTPITVLAVDNTTGQQGNFYTGTISSGSLNVGSLTACGVSAISYINYTVDGSNFTLTSQNNDSLQAWANPGWNTTINGINPSQPNLNIYFSFPGTMVGTTPMQYLMVNQYDSTWLVPPVNVNVTAFGQPGDFIEGNFSGQFKDQMNVTHNVSATFRVRRQ